MNNHRPFELKNSLSQIHSMSMKISSYDTDTMGFLTNEQKCYVMFFSSRLALLLRFYCLIYLNSILTKEDLYDILSRSFPLNSLSFSVCQLRTIRNMPCDKEGSFRCLFIGQSRVLSCHDLIGPYSLCIFCPVKTNYVLTVCTLNSSLLFHPQTVGFEE